MTCCTPHARLQTHVMFDVCIADSYSHARYTSHCHTAQFTRMTSILLPVSSLCTCTHWILTKQTNKEKMHRTITQSFNRIQDGDLFQPPLHVVMSCCCDVCTLRMYSLLSESVTEFALCSFAALLPYFMHHIKSTDQLIWGYAVLCTLFPVPIRTCLSIVHEFLYLQCICCTDQR